MDYASKIISSTSTQPASQPASDGGSRCQEPPVTGEGGYSERAGWLHSAADERTDGLGAGQTRTNDAVVSTQANTEP